MIVDSNVIPPGSLVFVQGSFITCEVPDYYPRTGLFMYPLSSTEEIACIAVKVFDSTGGGYRRKYERLLLLTPKGWGSVDLTIYSSGFIKVIQACDPRIH